MHDPQRTTGQCRNSNRSTEIKERQGNGHSGIRAEHLKELLRQSEKKDATNDDKMGWDQVYRTIQQIFETGTIPEEMTWSSILVLIPKTSRGTRGIELLETMWKVCSSIINQHLQNAIPFHEALHGF
jgi:hypothetical protein